MSSPAVQPLLALLAYPVVGNPTQYLVERSFARDDLDWRYLTFEVAPEDLPAAVAGLRALGFRGGHCADPHKQAVIPLLDRTTETAAAVGAVNFIFRDGAALVGDNLEGRGVVEALARAADPAGKQATLLGAGRLARATALELAAAGAAGLTVVDRTAAKAEELAALVAGKFPAPVSISVWEGEYSVLAETEILIHAATADPPAEETPLPLASDSLRPELIVADAALDAPRSWLLSEAARRGCKTIDGLSIFLEQVAIGLRLWTGVDPNRQVLREAAEEFLEL